MFFINIFFCPVDKERFFKRMPAYLFTCMNRSGIYFLCNQHMQRWYETIDFTSVSKDLFFIFLNSFRNKI